MLPVFFDSCRICLSVIRLASREFLFVSVYGFTNTHTAHKKSTMSILLYALQVAGETGLPCIIAGDMNCSVLQQDGWKIFHDSGFVEAHDLSLGGLVSRFHPPVEVLLRLIPFFYHLTFSPCWLTHGLIKIIFSIHMIH